MLVVRAWHGTGTADPYRLVVNAMAFKTRPTIDATCPLCKGPVKLQAAVDLLSVDGFELLEHRLSMVMEDGRTMTVKCPLTGARLSP